jgi:predicted dehydrogenase
VNRRLRLLVVGAGHMGRLHAGKVASALPADVVLAGIADRHLDRAEALAGELGGVRATRDPLALAGEADAAIVAVPTVAHCAVAGALLDAGLDVLVEKPIAATIAEAEELVARAGRSGRVLQVGHLEWHNPALRALRGRIHRPRFAEAHRIGPFPARATDVDVVRDLMIHDIDVLQRLLGEEPASLEAIGVPVLSEQADLANARLRFPGGCVANLTASRVSPTPVRKLRLFQADGYLSVDFLARSALVARRVGAPGAARIEVESVALEPDDPLVAQLRAFVATVRERGDTGASAQAGLRALRTALRVLAAMPPLGELS